VQVFQVALHKGIPGFFEPSPAASAAGDGACGIWQALRSGALEKWCFSLLSASKGDRGYQPDG
jgi:hypothetical protein